MGENNLANPLILKILIQTRIIVGVELALPAINKGLSHNGSDALFGFNPEGI